MQPQPPQPQPQPRRRLSRSRLSVSHGVSRIGLSRLQCSLEFGDGTAVGVHRALGVSHGGIEGRLGLSGPGRSGIGFSGSRRSRVLSRSGVSLSLLERGRIGRAGVRGRFFVVATTRSNEAHGQHGNEQQAPQPRRSR